MDSSMNFKNLLRFQKLHRGAKPWKIYSKFIVHLDSYTRIELEHCYTHSELGKVSQEKNWTTVSLNWLDSYKQITKMLKSGTD